MTQARKHTKTVPAAKRSVIPAQRRSKPKSDSALLHPAELPDQYARRVAGDCMAPAIKDGEAIIVDKRLPYKAGDLVVIYMRPELVAPGQIGIFLKRWCWAFHPTSNSRTRNIPTRTWRLWSSPSRTILRANTRSEPTASWRCIGTLALPERRPS
jgi:hypothetical protein